MLQPSPLLLWLLRLNAASKSFLIPVFSRFSPLDFYWFPNLKPNLRGRNCGSNEGVIDDVDEYLEDQEEGFYLEGISKMEKRWRNSIEAKSYIEK